MIKSRQDGQSKTWYLYAECEVQSGSVLRLRWEEQSDRDGECTAAKGASNERQLLEVPDTLNDDICPLWDESGESHMDWLQVDSVGDPAVYSISEAAGARDTWYTDQLKADRDMLLAECDWYAMRHRDQLDNSETTDLSGAEYTELLNYRKALRDWPADELDIYARTAPTKPAWM